MDSAALLVEALSALRKEDRDAAISYAAKAGTRLGDELRRHLEARADRSVYERPDAFATFVRGGGNVELYRRLSEELAAIYDELEPESLLDIGCGDGQAIAPALEQATHRPARIDLVEPSEALLDKAETRLAQWNPRTWRQRAQAFFKDNTDSWDVVQSTFALQSLPPRDRDDVLKTLERQGKEIVIAEFDTPEPPEDEYLRSLVTRYERGIAEYGEDASLVAQGFMLPMLLGQADPDSGRNNWEQPAARWREQLETAGFGEISVVGFADYWWAPAVLVRAR